MPLIQRPSRLQGSGSPCNTKNKTTFTFNARFKMIINNQVENLSSPDLCTRQTLEVRLDNLMRQQER